MNQKIKIKKSDAIDAYERFLIEDSAYTNPYLDKETGEIFCLAIIAQTFYDSELTLPEIRFNINLIRNDSRRYLKIGSISYDSVHRIVEAFIISNWTKDTRLKEIVHSCYDGSIYRWKSNMKQNNKINNSTEIISAFEKYYEDEIIKRLEYDFKAYDVEHEWI